MKKAFFDHIHKTGGTTIELIIKSILGDQATEKVIGLHRDLIKEYSNKHFISAHCSFYQKEQLDRNRAYFSLLRHPVDRALSHYFFLKNTKEVTANKEAYLAKSINTSDFFFSSNLTILDIISNFQVNHFIQRMHSDTLIDGEQLLESAKKALNQYHLVGVYHQFTDFVDILCYECGWLPVKEIPRINTTRNRQKVSEVDPKIIRRLEELNQLDLALYDYATQLFNEKKRQILHEYIERRHQELNAPSIYLAPSPQHSPANEEEEKIVRSPLAPLLESEGTCNAPAPADFGNRQLEILTIEVKGDISLDPFLFSGETARIRVIFHAHIDVDNLTVGIHIHDRFSRLAFGTNSECLGHTLHVRAGGVYFIDFHFRNDLGIGEYTIGAALHLGSSHLSGCFHWRDEVTRFEVVGNIGYHFEGVAKLYPQLRCGVLEGDPVGIQALLSAQDWPRLQQIAIHTPKLTEFSARLHLSEPLQRLSLHQVISVEAEITNTSSQTWGSTGQRPVHLSYHWQALDGGWLEFNGERTPLPHDLAPGETITHYLTIKAPPQPGPVRLHLTLVQEGVGWFDQHGCPALVLPISVEPGSLTT